MVSGNLPGSWFEANTQLALSNCPGRHLDQGQPRAQTDGGLWEAAHRLDLGADAVAEHDEVEGAGGQAVADGVNEGSFVGLHRYIQRLFNKLRVLLQHCQEHARGTL